jgi:hypothetical protein
VGIKKGSNPMARDEDIDDNQPTPPIRKQASLGCATKATAISVVLLGASVYLMGRWEKLDGAVRAAAIFLVILGTVFLLPLGLVILAAVLKQYVSKRIGQPLKESLASAVATVEEHKKLYVDRHEHRAATEADFVGRDRAWYDAATAELLSLGYQQLADRVNTTVENASQLVVVQRGFISGDHTTMTSIYQFVRPNKKTGEVIDLRLCDCESELSDGQFVTTSNSAASNLASLPPQIHSTKHPAETTPTELVALHEASKAKFVMENPGTTFVQIHSLEEYDASQQRSQAIKAAFRKGIGYVDPAEVRRIAEQKFPNDPDLVENAVATFDAARKRPSA